jgi:membrane peptidoglycan carboxypeptidase
VIYRAVRPSAGIGPFTVFLRAHDPEGRLDDRAIVTLYGDYDPGRLTLQDRGYLARIHPLELWLLEYRSRHPEAKLDELVADSANVRQEIYRWLFKDRYRRGQDHRIRTMLEADAFLEIHAAWKRMGYPFDRLVPSFATAIGSSGDNPAALAELMGILANGGIRQATVRIRGLRFGTGTPYATDVEPIRVAGERVLSSELAETVKAELVGVVREGTARRISGVFIRPDGTPIEVGGKTGTGDNRFKRYARGGREIGSRVVNRTATFAFIIDDRFFGTVTAFVPGEKASGYGFTSALPVALLKRLAPTLMPAFSAPHRAGS